MGAILGKIKIKQLSLVLLMLVVTGCSDFTVSIVEPESGGAVYTSAPPMSATWTGGELQPEDYAKQFKARLNGIDISNLFLIGPTSASLLPGADIDGKLRDGVNTLRITLGDVPHLPLLLITNNSKFVQFVVDVHGPEIHVVDVDVKSAQEEIITEVPVDKPLFCRTWPFSLRPVCNSDETVEVITVVETDSFTVEGYVLDPSGLASVSHTITQAEPPFNVLVNDQPADLVGNNFSFELPADAYWANDPVLIKITATDGLGRISVQDFYRNASGELPSSLSFLDNGSITDAITLILKGFGSDLVSDLAGEEGFLNFGFDIVLASFQVEALKIGGIGNSTYLQPSPGADPDFDVEGVIILTDVETDFEACLGPVCGGVFFNFPEMGLELEADIEGAADERAFVIGRTNIGVDLPDIEAGISIVGVNITLTPGVIGTLTARLVEFFIDVFIKIFNSKFLPLIDGLLNKFLERVVLEFQIGLYHAGTHRAMCVRAFADDMWASDGELAGELGIDVETLDFPNQDPLGIRVTSFTTTQDRLGPDGAEYDAVFSLSINIINQILFGVHKSGFFNLELPSLVAYKDRTLGARVEPLHPGHISLRQFELGMTEFHLWDLKISIQALIDEDRPELGYENIASGTLRIDVPLDFFIPEDLNDQTITSDFTEQVNASLVDMVYVAGNRPFNAPEAALVALSAAGPLLVLAADAMSALPQPVFSVTREGETPPPVAFWLDPQEGAFKLGLNLNDLLVNLVDIIGNPEPPCEGEECNPPPCEEDESCNPPLALGCPDF